MEGEPLNPAKHASRSIGRGHYYQRNARFLTALKDVAGPVSGKDPRFGSSEESEGLGAEGRRKGLKWFRRDRH